MKRFANSNWLLAIGCAVGIFIAGTAVAGDRADSKIIRAERFEVVDARGKVLALFGAYEGTSAAMVFFDANGHSRIVISMLPEGGTHIALLDKKMNSRILIAAAGAEGLSGILLRDRAGHKRVHLTEMGNIAILSFSDTNNVPRIEIGLDGNTPKISMYAPNGDPIPRLP